MALINKLTAIADAIRSKTGTTEPMTLDEMAVAIEGISAGGDELEVVVEKTQFEGEEYELPVNPGIVFAGQTLKITFDGVAYVCEPWNGKFGFICYGNGDYDAGNVGKGDSTVPFFFDESGFLATSSGTHTIKIELPSSGGSAEIPTCTVRFFSSGVDAGYYGYYSYSKYENGVISVVHVQDEDMVDEFEFTFSNVVCGTLINFAWVYYGDIAKANIDGSAVQIVNGSQAENESYLFKAPTVAGEICTIELTSEVWQEEW